MKIFYFLDADFSKEMMRERARKASLTMTSGSRVMAWRFLLDLIPMNRDSQTWVQAVKEQWEVFSGLTDKYSFKRTRKLDPNIFNPLAPPSKENKQLHLNNELRDIISKDVMRTFQEYKFFVQPKIQEQLKMILYFWSSENPFISYRQGMNEILAMLFFVFYAEKVSPSNLNPDDITDPDDVISYMNDETYISADIYTFFTRIMDLGIKELFGTSEDPSAIRRMFKQEDDQALFKFESEKKEEEWTRWENIEKIQEEERKNSAVLKRCNRMYH
jgi:hypothetical protein